MTHLLLGRAAAVPDSVLDFCCWGILKGRTQVFWGSWWGQSLFGLTKGNGSAAGDRRGLGFRFRHPTRRNSGRWVLGQLDDLLHHYSWRWVGCFVVFTIRNWLIEVGWKSAPAARNSPFFHLDRNPLLSPLPQHYLKPHSKRFNGKWITSLSLVGCPGEEKVDRGRTTFTRLASAHSPHAVSQSHFPKDKAKKEHDSHIPSKPTPHPLGFPIELDKVVDLLTFSFPSPPTHSPLSTGCSFNYSNRHRLVLSSKVYGGGEQIPLWMIHKGNSFELCSSSSTSNYVAIGPSPHNLTVNIDAATSNL